MQRGRRVVGGRSVSWVAVTVLALGAGSGSLAGCSWDWDHLDPALGTAPGDGAVDASQDAVVVIDIPAFDIQSVTDAPPADGVMTDSPGDVPGDGVDGAMDGAADVPVDAGLDGATDTAVDAPADTLTDAALDVRTDVPGDVPVDGHGDGAVGLDISCGTCAAGTTCCGLMCVDLTSDSAHCGGCAVACAAGQACRGGVCGACPAGQRDCGGGRCGTCCADADCPNHRACSSGGVCTGCASGYGDCDGNTVNGCEATLTTDVHNCNGCALACSVPHATALCSAATCGVATCAAGYADCDHMPANGCEASLQTDAANCGACGHGCTATHAAGVCVAGTCGLGTCASGYADCNHLASDGCEANVLSDPAHCGACGTTCPTAPNGTSTCMVGACGYTCNGTYADCNHVASDGCEVNTATSGANCGGCGVTCALPGATAGCSGGSCSVAACLPGHGDCNRIASDGCEVDTANDPFNCGGCGGVCSLTNATAGCMLGSCTVAMCSTGYDDCDRVAANGCETSTASDARNCGVCGRACAAGQTCVIGRCTASVSGYSVTTPPSGVTWIDACGLPGAIRVLTSTNGGAYVGTLPFPVTFWGGVNYDYFVSTEGYVGFGMLFYNLTVSPTLGPYASFGSLPGPGVPAPALFELGADLTTRGGGICVGTGGSAPNRTFVVETYDAQFTSSPDSHLTFETIAYENTQVFDVLYNSPWAGPAGVTTFNVPSDITVGLQDQQRAPLRAVPYTGAPVGSGTRIRFTPVP